MGKALYRPLVRLLIVDMDFSFAWTMRALALNFMVLATITNLVQISIPLPTTRLTHLKTLRRRLPPAHVSGGIFNFKALKYRPYLAYILALFTFCLGALTGHSAHPSLNDHLHRYLNFSALIHPCERFTSRDITKLRSLFPRNYQCKLRCRSAGYWHVE